MTASAPPLPAVSPRIVLAGLTGLTFLAWIVTARLMGGMDAGPGTPLGGFGGFVTSWVVMMAAMMLPAEMRFTLAFAQFSRADGSSARLATRIGSFLGGYLLCWTAFGCFAWLTDRLLRHQAPAILAWDAHGPLAAGALVAAAGLYQISPAKRACLRHCISPLGFFMQRWRPGLTGALHMGFAHGVYCIGCCWALMVMLFAVGIMSLFWMSLLAAVMFAEKILPVPTWFGPALALMLVLLGVWVACDPASVPMLTLPTTAAPHVH